MYSRRGENESVTCAAQQCDILQLHESTLKQLANVSTEPHDLSNNSKAYEADAVHQHYCSVMLSRIPSTVTQGSPATLESPEFLAHRLLVEFGKTRTNYNSLVPRIVEVMRLYRDYGPIRCPVPVVSNLDELLNDEALIRIEHRYPNSLDAGFLVLCTERRALRSGGGGKYYFIDVSGRLVGCHKSDLPNYADKGVLRGPVLLKNLIFVFIMRGAFGLDPRCKSSNPQRLLEYYENLAKEGKAMDVQRLVRVWSMEVFPEVPYDAGFPHCSLLWVKRMHVGAHITKWKRSQWHSSQLRGQDMYGLHRHTHMFPPVASLQYLHNTAVLPNEAYRDGRTTTSELAYAQNTKRRRTNEGYSSPGNNTSNYENWTAPQHQQPIYSTQHQPSTQDRSVQEEPPYEDNSVHQNKETPRGPSFPASYFLWDAPSVQALYSAFNEFAPVLQKADIVDWSVQIIEKLSPPILAAAIQLITTSFQIRMKEETDGKNEKALRYDILRAICEMKERERMTECLRILLACLVQQQRLEEFIPGVKTGEQQSDIISSQLSAEDFYNVFVKLEADQEQNVSVETPRTREPETSSSSTESIGGSSSSSGTSLECNIEGYCSLSPNTHHHSISLTTTKCSDPSCGVLNVSPMLREDSIMCRDEELWRCFNNNTSSNNSESSSSNSRNSTSSDLKKLGEQEFQENPSSAETMMTELLSNENNYLYRQGETYHTETRTTNLNHHNSSTPKNYELKVENSSTSNFYHDENFLSSAEDTVLENYDIHNRGKHSCSHFPQESMMHRCQPSSASSHSDVNSSSTCSNLSPSNSKCSNEIYVTTDSAEECHDVDVTEGGSPTMINNSCLKQQQTQDTLTTTSNNKNFVIISGYSVAQQQKLRLAPSLAPVSIMSPCESPTI